MSRRGNYWDNVVAENFSGTLKIELLYELPLQTCSATRAVMAEYIEDFYNVHRRHVSLDSRSPIEFELKSRRGALHGGSAPGPRSFLNEEEIRKDWVSRAKESVYGIGADPFSLCTIINSGSPILPVRSL
jgi:hypothetical protein